MGTDSFGHKTVAHPMVTAIEWQLLTKESVPVLRMEYGSGGVGEELVLLA